MERKLTKDEFVELFTLHRQRAERVRRSICRQDKTKGYNNFYRKEKRNGVWYNRICNAN